MRAYSPLFSKIVSQTAECGMGREDVGVSEVRGDSLESILLSGLSLGTLLNRVLFTLPMTARSLSWEEFAFP
jgi:hypothetical protein